MKVLFLDIDGVCNSANTTQRFGIYIGIDPVMADKVKYIIEATGCEVVLSSTWRLDKEFRDEVWDKVVHFLSVTPDMQQGQKYGVVLRGLEVSDWLERNPEVERYAILDDNCDFLEGQHLFKTSWSTGLTDEIADKVIAYLNGEAEYAAEDCLRS